MKGIFRQLSPIDRAAAVHRASLAMRAIKLIWWRHFLKKRSRTRKKLERLNLKNNRTVPSEAITHAMIVNWHAADSMNSSLIVMSLS